MIYEKDLNIYHDTLEISKELNDYQRDSATITFVTGSLLHIGLYKPFSAVYAELITKNINAINLSFSYYNGTDFTTKLPFTVDETNTFERSGFIKWNKPKDWVPTEVNGDNLYWIQLAVDSDMTETEIRAINILFSNDNELKKELSTVDKYLPPNENSFAPMHSTVRDDIVQSLRNRGKAKIADGDNTLSLITKWDLLDIAEVWTAAKYFALEKIFFQASDGVDDKWQQRQAQMSQEGNKAFDLLFLSLDTNDDGKEDAVEKLSMQSITVLRV